MGVDTKAIITKGTTLEQIVEALEKKYGQVKVSSSFENFFWLDFKDTNQIQCELNPIRSMAVSFNGTCKQDSGIDGVWMKCADIR